MQGLGTEGCDRATRFCTSPFAIVPGPPSEPEEHAHAKRRSRTACDALMTFSKKSIRKGDERDTDKAGGNALGPSGVSSRSENSDESCEGLGVLTGTRVLDGTKKQQQALRSCMCICICRASDLFEPSYGLGPQKRCPTREISTASLGHRESRRVSWGQKFRYEYMLLAGTPSSVSHLRAKRRNQRWTGSHILLAPVHLSHCADRTMTHQLWVG